MGILRTDVIAHSQLTAANASVLFDGGDGAGGSTGLRTADGDHGYAIGSEGESITIECWIYPTSVSQTFDTIFATNSYGVSGSGMILYNNNDGLYWSGTGFATDYTEYGIISLNTWHHVAMVKENKQLRVYLDGVCKAYRETTSNFNEDQLCIGCSNYGSGFPTYSFKGNISNFRINKRALYKENFTPSKFKLKNISGTTLLCCQDASDDTTAAVGSIVAGGSPTPGGFGPDLKEDTTDTGVVLEDNTNFDTLSYMVPPGGTTTESNRGRGLVGGGWSPSLLAQIYSVEIQSDGRSADFGDLTDARRGTGAVSSSTRAVWGGGYSPGYVDVMDYVTIATQSNALDFGNLDTGRFESSGVSNNTRGVFGASENPAQAQNVIQYITIASTGNATDFGDSTVATKKQASMNSSTRGIFAGGQDVPSPTAYLTIIDYITTATTGNATDFGDLTQNVFMCTGVSSSTRGVRGGGAKSPSPANTNVMDYVTIASTGNATDYGDLTTANQRSGGMSNSIRGLFSGGGTPDASTAVNSIDKITIQTIGNAVDFGDYIGTAVTQAAGCSDSHGGIS